MYLKQDKFHVVGISKSGIGCARFLLSKGAKCYVYDESESPKIVEECKKLEEEGAIWINKKGSEHLLRAFSL